VSEEDFCFNCYAKTAHYPRTRATYLVGRIDTDDFAFRYARYRDFLTPRGNSSLAWLTVLATCIDVPMPGILVLIDAVGINNLG